MKMLKVNGAIVDDSDAFFYDFFNEPHTSPKKVSDFLAEAGGEDIQVLINSGGGSVFAGSEIYTDLKNYPGKVHVTVSGLAASIASVIMLAGDTIKASPIAQVMIHNASMRSAGDHHKLKHDGDVLEGTSLSLASLYAERTGESVETMQDLMDKETWLTAQKAVELGLVDEVLNDYTPSLVASTGFMVSKEKIAEFRDLLNRDEEKQKQANLESWWQERFDRAIGLHIQAGKLAEKEKLETVETLENVATGEPAGDEKPVSPFAKFIKEKE